MKLLLNSTRKACPSETIKIPAHPSLLQDQVNLSFLVAGRSITST